MFDRNISFEIGGSLGVDFVSLPRVVTSRSNEKLRDDSRLANKQGVKWSVDRDAASLDELISCEAANYRKF